VHIPHVQPGRDDRHENPDLRDRHYLTTVAIPLFVPIDVVFGDSYEVIGAI